MTVRNTLSYLGSFFWRAFGMCILATLSGCIVWPVVYSRNQFQPSPSVTYNSGDVLVSWDSQTYIPITLIFSAEGPRANSPFPIGRDEWVYYRRTPNGYQFVGSFKADYTKYNDQVGYLNGGKTLLVYDGETILNATQDKAFPIKGSLKGALSRFNIIERADGKFVEFNALTGESTQLQPAAVEFVRANFKAGENFDPPNQSLSSDGTKLAYFQLNRAKQTITISGWDLAGNKSLFDSGEISYAAKFKEARVRFCAFAGDAVVALITETDSDLAGC